MRSYSSALSSWRRSTAMAAGVLLLAPRGSPPRPRSATREDAGELGVEVHGRAAGGLEVGDEEGLVLRVRVAGGVLEADEEGGDAAERLRERAHERDAAPRADLDR